MRKIGGTPSATLAALVTDRPAVLAEIQNSHQVDRSVAKALVLRLFFGGGYAGWLAENQVDTVMAPQSDSQVLFPSRDWAAICSHWRTAIEEARECVMQHRGALARRKIREAAPGEWAKLDDEEKRNKTFFLIMAGEEDKVSVFFILCAP